MYGMMKTANSCVNANDGLFQLNTVSPNTVKLLLLFISNFNFNK